MNPAWPDFEDCVRDFSATAVAKGYKPPPPPPPPPPPEMDHAALASAEGAKAAQKAKEKKRKGRASTILGGKTDKDEPVLGGK